MVFHEKAPLFSLSYEKSAILLKHCLFNVQTNCANMQNCFYFIFEVYAICSMFSCYSSNGLKSKTDVAYRLV